MRSDIDTLWRRVCEKLDPKHECLWCKVERVPAPDVEWGFHSPAPDDAPIHLDGNSTLAAIEAADVRFIHWWPVVNPGEQVIVEMCVGFETVEAYGATALEAFVRALAAALEVNDS